MYIFPFFSQQWYSDTSPTPAGRWIQIQTAHSRGCFLYINTWTPGYSICEFKKTLVLPKKVACRILWGTNFWWYSSDSAYVLRRYHLFKSIFRSAIHDHHDARQGSCSSASSWERWNPIARKKRRDLFYATTVFVTWETLHEKLYVVNWYQIYPSSELKEYREKKNKSS